MRHLALFGERSLTLIAALLPDQGRAMDLARRLSRDTADAQWADIELLHPTEVDVARRLEPDSQGIWRTACRSHAWLGAAGAMAGMLVGASLVAGGWPAAMASPGAVTAAGGVIGVFGGLLGAGLLTLRPDHGMVIHRVRAALRRGQWAVVARPRDEGQTLRCAAAMRQAGGQVLRSL